MQWDILAAATLTLFSPSGCDGVSLCQPMKRLTQTHNSVCQTCIHYILLKVSKYFQHVLLYCSRLLTLNEEHFLQEDWYLFVGELQSFSEKHNLWLFSLCRCICFTLPVSLVFSFGAIIWVLTFYIGHTWIAGTVHTKLNYRKFSNSAT